MSEPRTAALYGDVAALLTGTLPEPPAADVLARTDGHSLFYRGQTNLLFGDPESGKTWVALAAIAEELRDGGRALVLDMDHNGMAATVSRLLALGAPADALADLALFRYVEPIDREHLDAVIAEAVLWRPDVTVLDSVGELLPLFGASSNSPDDYTAVHARVMKPLAAHAGTALLMIDHLAKNTESRAQGATGTAAKRRTIGGTSIRVTVSEPFAPGRGGACNLLVHKDRHGSVRAVSPSEDREPIAGVFRMTVRDGVTFWSVRAPAAGERNPAETAPPEDIAAVAALTPPPENVNDARERLRWGKQRTARAVKAWREQGAPATVPGSDTVRAEPRTAPDCPSCNEPGCAGDCGGELW